MPDDRVPPNLIHLMNLQEETRFGYCQCGCRAKTNLALCTERRFGWVKGEPLRFIEGHGSRKRTKYDVHENGCWIWRSVDSSGYATGSANGKRTTLIHRAMYEMLRGPIPSGLHLDHLCRNRACVNPGHLEPVTQAENNRRAAKLTRDDAENIRALSANGITRREILSQYMIGKSQFHRIINGESWGDDA